MNLENGTLVDFSKNALTLEDWQRFYDHVIACSQQEKCQACGATVFMIRWYGGRCECSCCGYVVEAEEA